MKQMNYVKDGDIGRLYVYIYLIYSLQITGHIDHCFMRL